MISVLYDIYRQLMTINDDYFLPFFFFFFIFLLQSIRKVWRFYYMYVNLLTSFTSHFYVWIIRDLMIRNSFLLSFFSYSFSFRMSITMHARNVCLLSFHFQNLYIYHKSLCMQNERRNIFLLQFESFFFFFFCFFVFVKGWEFFGDIKILSQSYVSKWPKFEGLWMRRRNNKIFY